MSSRKQRETERKGRQRTRNILQRLTLCPRWDLLPPTWPQLLRFPSSANNCIRHEVRALLWTLLISGPSLQYVTLWRPGTSFPNHSANGNWLFMVISACVLFHMKLREKLDPEELWDLSKWHKEVKKVLESKKKEYLYFPVHLFVSCLWHKFAHGTGVLGRHHSSSRRISLIQRPCPAEV
jgi:hypothetical protein